MTQSRLYVFIVHQDPYLERKKLTESVSISQTIDQMIQQKFDALAALIQQQNYRIQNLENQLAGYVQQKKHQKEIFSTEDIAELLDVKPTQAARDYIRTGLITAKKNIQGRWQIEREEYLRVEEVVEKYGKQALRRVGR